MQNDGGLIRDIEARLDAKRISVSRVCRAAGVERSTWHRWKMRHAAPRPETWERVRASLLPLIGEVPDLPARASSVAAAVPKQRLDPPLPGEDAAQQPEEQARAAHADGGADAIPGDGLPELARMARGACQAGGQPGPGEGLGLSDVAQGQRPAEGAQDGDGIREAMHGEDLHRGADAAPVGRL
jgi:hypothetical protein